MQRWRLGLGAGLIGVSLTACIPPDASGDDDSGEPTLDVNVESPFCETTSRPLTSLDEVTEIGYSGLSVLQFAEGEHVTAMKWREAADGVQVEFGADLSATGLSLNVDFGAAPLGSFNKSVPVYPAGDQGEDIVCLSSVSVPATITLATDDGVLDETWEVELFKLEDNPVLGTGFDVQAFAELTPALLQFQVVQPAGGEAHEAVSLVLEFPSAGPSGSLSLTGEVPADGSTFALTFGEWSDA